MFGLQLGESTAELLVLCPQPPHLADQLANHANQVRLRQTFQRIRGASGHPQLESHFRGLDSPLARKFAPVALNVYSASGGIPRRKISSASTSCAKASSSCCLGIVATALISSCENERPSAAPICATSRIGASRSSRARSEPCSVVGIASGATGPA